MKETFLYQPIKPFAKSQNFGEDRACTDIESGNIFIYKEDKAVCPIGYVSLYKKLGLNGHNGVDYPAYMWQPVYASCDGYVEELQTNETLGLGIGIVTDNQYFCFETGGYEYFKYRNWHFQALNVVKGQKIKTGDLIGWAGMTGYATGVHVHFELKPIRKSMSGKIYNVLQTNGFFGAIDPSRYMLNVCAVDIDKFKKIKETFAIILDKLSTILRKN